LFALFLATPRCIDTTNGYHGRASEPYSSGLMVASAPGTRIYVGNGVSNGWKETYVTNV
jgi:hypothetical protein